MRLGLDFDNTIVSYDELFHRVALEQGAIPASIPSSKLAVRDHLRQIGQEPAWTGMQGLVYGARMDEAAAYPGVQAFLRAARAAGWSLAIISHKTRHPFLGPQYDLHAAARGWIEHHLTVDGEPLVDPAEVYFETTKEAKLARIAHWQATHFIDDLPEILQAPGFPANVHALLFDPDNHHGAAPGSGTALPATPERVSGWDELRLRLGLA
jgi:hypothetical protein